MPNMTDEAQAAYNEARKTIIDCRSLRVAETRLDLSGLGLPTLPPEIGQVTALTRLYLGNNRLTSLPPEIGQLTALTSLILYFNQLTSLPPKIGRLNALRQLDLDYNQLTVCRRRSAGSRR
jgi:internalin A